MVSQSGEAPLQFQWGHFRSHKPVGDDYSLLITQSLQHISWHGRGMEELRCLNCFHRTIHIVYTSYSCLSQSHYSLRRIIKSTTKCVCVCVERKEQQTGLSVPWCEFDTAMICVVCMREIEAECVLLCDEENACSSHAPLKHEKRCRQAGWQPEQHTAAVGPRL